MPSRVGFPRRSLSALACGATLLSVSACGSSTPTSSTSMQVSQAVKSKLESTLERTSAHLTAAEATAVTDCLVPTLKAHGITTLSAANAYGSTEPPWLKSASAACANKVGLIGGTGTST